MPVHLYLSEPPKEPIDYDRRRSENVFNRTIEMTRNLKSTEGEGT